MASEQKNEKIHLVNGINELFQIFKKVILIAKGIIVTRQKMTLKCT